jgi:hypothetical protein
MVAAFKEYVFDFADIKLSVICEQCHAETIIDLSSNKSRMFEYCHACRNKFDDNFIRALYDFQSAYLGFTTKVQRSVSAHIRVRSELKASES